MLTKTPYIVDICHSHPQIGTLVIYYHIFLCNFVELSNLLPSKKTNGFPRKNPKETANVISRIYAIIPIVNAIAKRNVRQYFSRYAPARQIATPGA